MLFSKCLISKFAVINSRFISSKKLLYEVNGNPEDVLHIVSDNSLSLLDNDILVRFCAAPVHPADINTIQGVYPIKPPLPATPGNEGVACVVQCGKNVKKFSVGDYVLPATVSSGTWREHAVYPENTLINIAKGLPETTMAVMGTNPATAYRMLIDFKKLEPGDCVMQNGSTSAVGIYAIQIAKILGFNTINVFRPRETPEGTENVRQSLIDYGGTFAFTEDEIKTQMSSSKLKSIGPIKLALNCLGGKSVLNLLRYMHNDSILVSYGAMTRQPMSIPVGPLIFKDVHLRGFWMSAWINKFGLGTERIDMFNQLTKWFLANKIKPSPFSEVPFENWQDAIKMSSFTDKTPTGLNKKVILVMKQ